MTTADTRTFGKGRIRRAAGEPAGPDPATGQPAGDPTTGQRGPSPFFAEPVREYVGKTLGRPLTVLRAGCLAPVDELGLDQLPCAAELEVTTADVEHPAVRAILGLAGVEGAAEVGGAIVGDLRTAPLRPRAFDIVHCAMLLERVSNVEVVLDRLAGALRPGGILLLQITDRECAAGLLDRRLPRGARRALWRRYRPQTPGPFPAIYEPTVSARGIHGYTLMRGLVITSKTTACSEPAVKDRVTGVARAACALISWLTRGRRAADYDQLLYVIRKPEDRFARVV
jgi:SAM-dependent methyltransferase